MSNGPQAPGEDQTMSNRPQAPGEDQTSAPGGQGMVDFLGAAPDPRLLDEDLANLPAGERRPARTIATRKHDRLVAAGSLLTGTTLLGGTAATLYGGGQALFGAGDALDTVLAAVGLLLVGTHWGWVHVAEYVGLSIDERRHRVSAAAERDWLASVQPYPRFSIATSVLDDASTRVQRVRHRPVLTAQHTFTFVRETAVEKTYDAEVSAEVLAGTVEEMRRRARLDTDRLRECWEAASTAYAAALWSAQEDQQRLAAQRAAAVALSEHLNASLLEPPLAE